MLYIIRHGRTDWNDQEKLQGRTDIPLNEAGREMAREAAGMYRDVHFDICFCSPLVRAQETARILLEGRDVPIVLDERLAEMYFGPYEGLDMYTVNPDSPVFPFFAAPESYQAPQGAESLQALFERTGAFLREAAEPLLAEGKDVLIVGHGAMNSSIICQVKNIPLEQFWSTGIENCRLMQLK